MQVPRKVQDQDDDQDNPDPSAAPCRAAPVVAVPATTKEQNQQNDDQEQAHACLALLTGIQKILWNEPRNFGRFDNGWISASNKRPRIPAGPSEAPWIVTDTVKWVGRANCTLPIVLYGRTSTAPSLMAFAFVIPATTGNAAIPSIFSSVPNKTIITT